MFAPRLPLYSVFALSSVCSPPTSSPSSSSKNKNSNELQQPTGQNNSKSFTTRFTEWSNKNSREKGPLHLQ